jgi:hypothetical protein
MAFYLPFSNQGRLKFAIFGIDVGAIDMRLSHPR